MRGHKVLDPVAEHRKRYEARLRALRIARGVVHPFDKTEAAKDAPVFYVERLRVALADVLGGTR